MAGNGKKEHFKKKINKAITKFRNLRAEIEKRLVTGQVSELNQYPMKFRPFHDEYYAIENEYAEMFNIHYSEMDKSYPMFLIDEDPKKHIVRRVLDILTLIDRIIENLENMLYSIP
jgi:hypothetical protein